jgi:hypothetical protein
MVHGISRNNSWNYQPLLLLNALSAHNLTSKYRYFMVHGSFLIPGCSDHLQQTNPLSAVAHCYCNCPAILPSVVLLPLSPIAIVLLPLPSPIAAATAVLM